MNLVLAATIALVSLSVGITAWVVGRQFIRKWLSRKLLKQAEVVQKQLRGIRDDGYRDLDKLLFDMRDTYDPNVIEDQLRTELDANEGVSPALVEAFALMGLTERYLKAVRSASGWQERAAAAAALGTLGEVRAAAPLIEALRDPDEDADVKLACAEALGQIRDPEVIPELCRELANVDEWSSPRIAKAITSFGKLAVEPLLNTLDAASSTNARVWAAQVLGKIGDERAVPELIERLHDRSEQMRLSAANALGDIGSNRSVRPLIELILRDPVAGVRSQAASALGRIGDDGALPLLVTALGDPEYWMRFRALEAIELLNPNDASPIENALKDRNPEVRRRATLALDRLGKLDKPFADLRSDDDARVESARARLIAVGKAGLSERLARYLTDDDPKMRARIASILGPIGDPAHANSLVKSLEDPSPQVRLCVLQALGDLRAPTTAQALVQMLTEGGPLERNAAVEGLMRFEPEHLESVLPDILELSRHESDDIRIGAARVLTICGGVDVIQRLSELLRDRDAEIRFHAVTALGKDPQDSMTAFIGLCLADPSEKVRVAASDTLGRIGSQAAVELLLASIPQADAKQRESICLTLAGLGFEAVQPVLDVLLASDDENMRLSAVWTLGKTGDPRAAKLLTLFLHESSPTLRSSVAGALGKIRSEEAATAVASILDDPNPRVRSASINALANLSRFHDGNALVPLLEDPDDFVRNRAVISLARVQGTASHGVIEALDPQLFTEEFRVVALALCGSPAGVGRAVEALRDPEVHKRVQKRLRAEPDDVRRLFWRNVRLDGDQDPGLKSGSDFGEVGASVLTEMYIDSLRNSREPDDRRRAAAALGNIQDDLVPEALAEALQHDPDESVRIGAAEGLRRHSGGIAQSALLRAVLDPSERVRIAAIEGVAGQIEADKAAPLFTSLRAKNDAVLDATIAALAQIFAEPLEDFHDWFMGQTEARLQVAGLRVLKSIGDSRSLRLLALVVRDKNPDVRVHAAEALAALKTPDALEAMLGTLSDPLEQVRVGAVKALAHTTRADVMTRLQQVCLDPSAAVRATLAQTVATMNATVAIEILERLIDDHDAAVSAHAAVGLVTVPDPAGLPLFLQSFPELGQPTQAAIRGHAGPACTRLGDIIQTGFEADERGRAVQALALIDPVVNADTIAHALKDPDATVRLAAVRVLSGLEPERVGDWLKALQNDPVEEVRAAARRYFVRSVD